MEMRGRANGRASDYLGNSISSFESNRFPSRSFAINSIQCVKENYRDAASDGAIIYLFKKNIFLFFTE